MTAADADINRIAFGNGRYTPTALQIRLVVAFLQSDGTKSPALVLRDVLGGKYATWYQWQHINPEFLPWWNECLERTAGGTTLQQVHLAIARRALKGSATDARTYLERFDPKYKPSSSVTLDAGFTPGSVAGSNARQRALQTRQNDEVTPVNY